MLNAPGGLLLDLSPLDSEGLLLTLTTRREGQDHTEEAVLPAPVSCPIAHQIR